MIDAFVNRNGDLHSITAQSLFTPRMTIEEFMKVKDDEPYKTYRYKSKILNFSMVFSKLIYSLAQDLKSEWSEDELQDFIDVSNVPELWKTDKKGNPVKEDSWMAAATFIHTRFFNTYPRIIEMSTSFREQATSLGYVDVPFMKGSRRHLPMLLHEPDAKYGDKDMRKRFVSMMNIAVNSNFQCGESIHMYRGMIKINGEIKKRSLKSHLMCFVHDYVGFYVHKNEIEEVFWIVKNALDDLKSFSVPLLSEMSIGKIWENGEKLNEKNVKQVAEKLK